MSEAASGRSGRKLREVSLDLSASHASSRFDSACAFGQEFYLEGAVLLLVHRVGRHKVPICPITCEVDLDHLLPVCLPGFPTEH